MINLLKKHPFFNDKTIESCTLLEHQGYCNENYLLVVDSVKYIIRSFVKNDVDRVQEFDIQKQASNFAIAPEPLLLNLEDGYMVMEFIEGTHKKKLDIETLYNLLDCISTLHDEVFIQSDMLNIKEVLHKRNEEINDALDTIEFCEKYTEDSVVSHNDLNPMNILWQGDKPILLDFEYASVNDCYFDLAAISIEFSLDKKEESLMLRRYFGGVFFREKFDAYKIIYKVLCEEWFQKNL